MARALYCNTKLLRLKCIATWYSVLQLGSRESVSQYTWCIVTGKACWLGNCIARQQDVL